MSTKKVLKKYTLLKYTQKKYKFYQLIIVINSHNQIKLLYIILFVNICRYLLIS